MLLSYWLYAFQTTTYLNNCLPTLVLHHQSPYFTLYHKLPAYTHLKAFGCFCFPYLRPYNTHKLQYRSLECAFLHYNSHHKGYLCLDIHSSRVYISRHLIFNEDSFPFKNLSSSLSYFISSSSSLSIHLFIHLPLISPSPPTSSSSTCSPLVAPTSLPSFSHSMSSSVPPSSLLPPSVDLPVPCVDKDLLASSHTHNIHPMVTRSKASIYKPKLLLSVFTNLSMSLLPFSKLLKILHGSRPWNWNLFPLSTTRPSILFLHFPQAR